jgi:oligopeptide transport system substrate-binding protein
MKKLFLMLTLFIMILSCGGTKTSGTTVTLNFIDEPKTIDPQLATDTSATKLNALLTEGLTRQDEKGNPVPGIAEKWDISEDGLVWTFHLRDAKWENGEPITAADFKFGWLRAVDPKTAAEYAYMIYPIKGAEEFNTGKGSKEDVGIKVIDDKTLEVTLKSPTAYLPALLSFQTFAPINEKFYASVGESYALDSGKVLSSGPYKLVKWTHNEGLDLVKNENYWDKANVKIDNVKVKLINDTSASLGAFKNDELDVTAITVEQYQEFKDDKRLTPYDDGSVWYLEYNLKNKFLSNKKIRQALTLAVDKEELGGILQQMGKPAYGYVPEFIQGVSKSFREEAGDTFPHYNPDEARKLYAED